MNRLFFWGGGKKAFHFAVIFFPRKFLPYTRFSPFLSANGIERPNPHFLNAQILEAKRVPKKLPGHVPFNIRVYFTRKSRLLYGNREHLRSNPSINYLSMKMYMFTVIHFAVTSNKSLLLWCHFKGGYFISYAILELLAVYPKLL